MTLLIPFFLLPSYSSAAIYKFIDDQGVIHFVDTYDSIPEKYRGKIAEEKIKEGEKEGEAKPQKPYKPALKQETAKDKKDEKSEAKVIEEWNKKLKDAKEKLAKAKAALDEAQRVENRTVSSYSRKNYTNADRRAAQEATETAKKNLEEAQKEWDDLSEKAMREAPYSWWRENFYK